MQTNLSTKHSTVYFYLKKRIDLDLVLACNCNRIVFSDASKKQPVIMPKRLKRERAFKVFTSLHCVGRLNFMSHIQNHSKFRIRTSQLPSLTSFENKALFCFEQRLLLFLSFLLAHSHTSSFFSKRRYKLDMLLWQIQGEKYIYMLPGGSKQEHFRMSLDGAMI